MWQQLDQWDRRLMRRMHRLPIMAQLQYGARWASLSGDGAGYALFALLLLMLLPDLGQPFLLVGLSAYAVELPLYWLLKNGLKRLRPCNSMGEVHSHITPSDYFSFPSGHSAAAFVFATLLAWLWPPIAWLAYGWATAVALSRLVLGVHYPGDVIVGAMLGCAAAQWALWLLYPSGLAY